MGGGKKAKDFKKDNRVCAQSHKWCPWVYYVVFYDGDAFNPSLQVFGLI